MPIKKSPGQQTEGAPSTSEASSPRSLMRLLGLLSLLSKAPEGFSLTQISVALKAPKSSLLTLLRPLVAEGYLTSDSGRYHLGPPVYRLAAEILSGRRFFPKLIRPYIEHLAEVTGETVILTTLDEESRRVIYIEVVESSQTIRYSVPPGTTRPLYASTAGRVLLAFQDMAWQTEYLKSEKFKAFTPNTMVSKEDLRKDLDEIAKQGYAVGFGQMVQGAAAIAAPLFDTNGKIVEALMIGAPTDRVRANLTMYKDAIIDASVRISGDLRSFGAIT